MSFQNDPQNDADQATADALAAERLAALRRMYQPDPSKPAVHVAARIWIGSRWHVGYLVSSGTNSDNMRIRDNTRAARSQYVLVHRNNVAGIQFPQANGRYASPWDAS